MEAMIIKLGNVLLSQYGVLGIVVVGLVAYIVWKEVRHGREREELVHAMEKQHAEALEVTRGNITVLSEVKTLIQTIVRH